MAVWWPCHQRVQGRALAFSQSTRGLSIDHSATSRCSTSRHCSTVTLQCRTSHWTRSNVSVTTDIGP